MPPLYPGWPYAAKAVIQHEWHIDHLHIWLTFRHAMDQAVKPANALWLCTADGTLRAVFASAWQDAWTLLLTTIDFAGPPDRVLVKYDGPDPNLRISWNKQWEPWGPILSLDITS